jgi:hypothetical protein
LTDEIPDLNPKEYGSLMTNEKLTYKEKVRLYMEKRYLMPATPFHTERWTMRDFIRFIDQRGRWCPEGEEGVCELL